MSPILSCFGIWACGLGGFLVPHAPPPPPIPPVPQYQAVETNPAPKAPVPPATLLSAAESTVGATPADLGIADSFWCASYVEYLLTTLGWTDDDPMDSPAQLQARLAPSDSGRGPGDLIVFVTFQPENSQTHHVAVVTEITADGVFVIEGNGASATEVAQGFWPHDQVVGYAMFAGPNA